jgi:FkbM family methyltransferase
MWTYQDLLQLKTNENYLSNDYPLADSELPVITHPLHDSNYLIYGRVGTNDVNTVLAIVDNLGEYGRIPEEPQSPGSIVDIGSYVGGFVRLALEANQNRPIVAIEPMIANVAMVQRNTRQFPNNPAGTYLFNLAVGVSGHVPICGPPEPAPGDVVHKFMGNVNGAENNPTSRIVKCINLEEFLTLNEICTGTKQIFFMKIDCEGGEYPFFEPATTEQIRHIKYIVGEFHNASIEAPDYMFLKHGYERFKISENDAGGLFAYKRID